MSGYNPEDCPACMERYRDQPHLTGACASVGIEHGKSAEEVVRLVLAAYHHRGHPADLGAALKIARPS